MHDSALSSDEDYIVTFLNTPCIISNRLGWRRRKTKKGRGWLNESANKWMNHNCVWRAASGFAKYSQAAKLITGFHVAVREYLTDAV